MALANRDQRFFAQFTLAADEPIERVRIKKDARQASDFRLSSRRLMPLCTLEGLGRDRLGEIETLLDRKMPLERADTTHSDDPPRLGVANGRFCCANLCLCHRTYVVDGGAFVQDFLAG